MRKLNVDPDLFDNPTMPEVVYLMGLIWADGNLCRQDNHRIKMSLLGSDMQDILPHILKTGKWNYKSYRARGLSNKIHIYIKTGNKKLYDILANLDYEQKSCVPPLKVLNYIDESLLHYWWLGFFDGDGGWHISNQQQNIRDYCRYFAFNGPCEYDWNFVVDMFNKLDIEHYYLKRIKYKCTKTIEGGSSYIKCSRKSEIIKFGNYIYQNYTNNNIGMTRKYNKYLEIFNSYSQSPRTKGPDGKFIKID